VDPATSRAFAYWFVICIVLTVSGVLPVANVAHGVGALTGGLYGLARTRRILLAPLAAVVALAFVLDVEPVRDRVNLVGEPATEAEQRGIAALEAGENERAIHELEHAVALAPDDPRVLYNLAVAHTRTGDESACAIFHRVLVLEPGNVEAQRAVDACRGR
jgi:hypothetical protein